MAEPSGTNLSVGTWASAAGTLASVAGQIYAAQQARALGRYNAAVAQNNAQMDAYRLQVEAAQQRRLAAMAEQQKIILQQAADFREARFRESFERLHGQAVATAGASGIAIEGSSPLYVMEENARQAGLEIQAMRYNAQLQGRALDEEALQRRYAADLAQWGAKERLRVGSQQAGIADFLGQQQASAAYMGAAGAALQGGASFYQSAQRDYWLSTQYGSSSNRSSGSIDFSRFPQWGPGGP